MASIIIRSILLLCMWCKSELGKFDGRQNVIRRSHEFFRHRSSQVVFFLSPAPVLLDWVEYPSEDWGFSLALLNHVESICD